MVLVSESSAFVLSVRVRASGKLSARAHKRAVFMVLGVRVSARFRSVRGRRLDATMFKCVRAKSVCVGSTSWSECEIEPFRSVFPARTIFFEIEKRSSYSFLWKRTVNFLLCRLFVVDNNNWHILTKFHRHRRRQQRRQRRYRFVTMKNKISLNLIATQTNDPHRVR